MVAGKLILHIEWIGCNKSMKPGQVSLRRHLLSIPLPNVLPCLPKARPDNATGPSFIQNGTLSMEQKCLRTMTDKRNIILRATLEIRNRLVGLLCVDLEIFEALASGSRPSSPNGATVITVLFHTFPWRIYPSIDQHRSTISTSTSNCQKLCEPARLPNWTRHSATSTDITNIWPPCWTDRGSLRLLAAWHAAQSCPVWTPKPLRTLRLCHRLGMSQDGDPIPSPTRIDLNVNLYQCGHPSRFDNGKVLKGPSQIPQRHLISAYKCLK